MASRRQWSALVFFALILLEILMAFLPVEGEKLLLSYAWPLGCIFIGLTLPTYPRKLTSYAGFFLIAWFMLSRILLGDIFMQDAMLLLAKLFCAYGVFLPFAMLHEEEERYTALRSVALGITAVMAICGWLCVIQFIMKFKGNELPLIGSRIHFTKGRLSFRTNENTTAELFLLGLMSFLWLSLRRKKAHPALTFLNIGTLLALIMTNSRTVIIQLSLTFGALAGLCVLHKYSQAAAFKRLSISISLGILATAAAYLLIQLLLLGEEQLIAPFLKSTAHTGARSLALDQLDNRTSIYRACFRLLDEHPKVLALGTRDWFSLFREYYPSKSHPHSAYLLTLISAGIPGLLFTFALSLLCLKSCAVSLVCKGVALDEQFVCVVPVILLISALVECYLFVSGYPLIDAFFLICLGCAIQIGRKYARKR